MTALEEARDAVGRGAWTDAFERFGAAGDGSLEPEDLESLAVCAAMLARTEDSVDAWTRAHNAWLETDRPRAARCAFWLGMGLITQGERARGGAWIGRAAKTLEEAASDCAETGLLRLPAALMTLESGDAESALRLFREALEIGERFREPSLVALANLGSGRSLVAMRRIPEGLAALDQAMIAITADGVMPMVPGIVYCATILVCYEAFDIERAHEWTRALDAWSAPQQGLVPFRGQCLVHRAQIMQMHGAWSEAMAEATSARDRLSEPPGQPAVGMAWYQLGELHRERGAFAEAEKAYRDANQAGHSVQPGLALLRLAQGKREAAAASIATALEEAQAPAMRLRLLPAAVEIALAAGDVKRGRAAADELSAGAAENGAPLLRAAGAEAEGAVRLAEGDARGALASLREAQRRWQELDVPYQVARVRVLVCEACRRLGDDETAELERAAARRTFEDLGAAPALAALDPPDAKRPDGLTPREAEVLKLVATGKTNKAIAESLVISQKTVARHLSNIFTKLGLSTRAEAAAYAFKHDLA